MVRRLLALLLALCVVAGLAVAPAPAVALVCRMTGRPMAPIVRPAGESGGRVAEAARRMPCCVVKAQADGEGQVRFALAAPSCCDLRVSASRDHGPRFVTPEPLHLAIATMPAVAVLRFPISPEAAIPFPPIARESAPRGPPRRTACLRAPPVFS